MLPSTFSLLILMFGLQLAYPFEVEECPVECHCQLDGLTMMVDCSNAELSEFPIFPDNQVHMLDLSNNNFNSIPSELQLFEYLQYLDMTENKISRLKGNSLNGLSALRYLNLSKNNISSWMAINPQKLLEPAVSLLELSLSGNPLSSFTTNDENLLLISNSLRMLDLSHCRITKVVGQEILRGMSELKHLNLASNHIRSVADLISPTLTTLDLSHNLLTSLSINFLTNLPELTFVDFSWNHGISLQNKQGDFVSSESVKKIDLTHCNLDRIQLEGFPGLVKIALKENMIRELTPESFANCRMVEYLDLSYNSINPVDVNTFKKLKHLKSLNLSFNNIGKIESNTFKDNEQLTDLDLSRNQLNRLNRISALGLSDLKLSGNQIVRVDPDVLSGLPSLTNLDLSLNLIVELPDSLSSEFLQDLNLWNNRITHITSRTFEDFPEIRNLNLAGNRFTTPLRPQHFSENIFLEEISLDDNPWHCNCQDLFHFFIFLTDQPAKVRDRSVLRCQSPEEVFGRTWESACYLTWYPESKMGTTEKIWTFFMVSVIAFSGCLCLIISIKRGIKGRELTRREQERIQNLEEARELQRENRMRMQQEALRDAPDARESRPPCYSDAIRMPRLDGSFASLNELSNKRKKSKKSAENDDDDEVPLRRNRCRSEEVISMRDTSSRAPPRVHPFEVEQLDRQTFHEDDINNPQNSNVILNLEHSPRASRMRSSAPNQRSTANRSDGIQNFNQSINSVDRSPYSKRTKNFSPEPSGSNSKQVEIIDDHFKADTRTDSDDDTDDEFITINASENMKKSNSDEYVIISSQKNDN